MSKKIIECGICFESLDSKQISYCTELDCYHIFHDKCLKNWCKTCVINNNKPNCPLCRNDISNENLEIIGINTNQTDTQIISSINSINLFNYIIDNKIYNDIEKLQKIMERYPNEFDNIYYMLDGYLVINSLDNILQNYFVN